MINFPSQMKFLVDLTNLSWQPYQNSTITITFSNNQTTPGIL